MKKLHSKKPAMTGKADVLRGDAYWAVSELIKGMEAVNPRIKKLDLYTVFCAGINQGVRVNNFQLEVIELALWYLVNGANKRGKRGINWTGACSVLAYINSCNPA